MKRRPPANVLIILLHENLKPARKLNSIPLACVQAAQVFLPLTKEDVEEHPMVEYTRGLGLEYADSLFSLEMVAETNGT